MKRRVVWRGARHAPWLSLAWAFAVCVVCSLSTSRADAFCRKTTGSPKEASYNPAETQTCGDKAGALPLYWAQSCIEYRVIVEPELTASKGLTLDDAKGIVNAAVMSWVQAPCPRTKGGVRSPSIRLVDVDDARCDGGPRGSAASTKNEVRFRAAPPPDDASSGTLAVTSNTYLPTGVASEGQVAVYDTQIFDKFKGEDAKQGLINSLTAIVRHELGHFLGIAHSDHNDAVMFAFYNNNPSPGLTEDDAAAICDAYNPDAPIGGGCSVAPVVASANASGADASAASIAPLFAAAAAIMARAGRGRGRTSRRGRTKLR